MNKRKFIKSLGALAVGCMMASGMCWRSPKTESVKTGKWIENPEWVNAKYEMNWILAPGVKLQNSCPARSNNPNMLRDNDFIPPFVLVDA